MNKNRYINNAAYAQTDSNTTAGDTFTKEGSIENSANKMNAKKKTLIAGGIIAAVVATGAGIAYAVKKGKSVKLRDIKFDKGIANINDSKFSGKIKDVLKNGDK